MDYVYYRDYINQYIDSDNYLLLAIVVAIAVIVFANLILNINKSKDKDSDEFDSFIKHLFLTVVLVLISINILGHINTIENEKYWEQYKSALYEHYFEYQFYIENIIEEPSYEKTKDENEYTLIINKDEEKKKIRLDDHVAEFSKEIDNNSDKSYYELQTDDENHSVKLVKYIGSKEYQDKENKKQIKKIWIE